MRQMNPQGSDPVTRWILSALCGQYLQKSIFDFVPVSDGYKPHNFGVVALPFPLLESDYL